MSVVFPYNDKNAIKSAAFALEFNKEFDEDILNTIKKLYLEETQFQKDFPKEEIIQTVKMQMGPNIQEISTLQLGGLNYTAQSADGFTWKLLIQGNIVSVTCNEYTRWDEVWKFSKHYFKKILSLLDGYALNKVVLEYLDEFHIKDMTDNKWLDELFKTDSPYVPKFVYEASEPWHSHNGFISKNKDSQTINLINMNLLKNNMDLTANLMMQTQHASSLLSPVSLNGNISEGIQIIEKTMEDNHEFNKELLTKHLTQNILDKLSLKVV